MLTLPGSEYRIPRRFRFIGLWLARCLFIGGLLLVVLLIAQVLITLHNNHGHWLLSPQSHQPMSPDFIRYRSPRKDLSRRVCED
jgi:hypothetical protein